MNKILLIIVPVVFFLTGCGNTYVYKPISYMTQDTTSEQALASCEYEADIARQREMAIREAETQRHLRRKQEERMRNPSYTHNIDCSKYGYGNYSCIGTSSINQNVNGSIYDMAYSGASTLGSSFGSFVRKTERIEKCMESKGYRKTKVEEEVVFYKGSVSNSSSSINSEINNNRVYSANKCKLSPPWGVLYYCKDGMDTYNGKGFIKSGSFYPEGDLKEKGVEIDKGNGILGQILDIF